MLLISPGRKYQKSNYKFQTNTKLFLSVMRKVQKFKF